MGQFQPDGWHTVTPRIVTSEPGLLVEFVRSVFGAEGEFANHRPSEIRIGDSVVMISDGGGLRDAMPAFLYVYVANVDQTFQRAIQQGATEVETPIDLPYGDRRATFRDRWDNLWQIACRRDG